MNPVWMASMILQWAVLVVLCLLALSLMRQLGKLALRLHHVPERSELFATFSELPQAAVPLLNGQTFRIGGEQPLPCLLVFFSPKCGACEHLPDAVREFVKKKSPGEFSLLAVIDIPRSAAAKFISEKSLEPVPTALLENFPDYLKPPGSPFAVTITADGRIAARGKPKYILHLLEMADAAQYMAGIARQKHEWGESVPYLEGTHPITGSIVHPERAA